MNQQEYKYNTYTRGEASRVRKTRKSSRSVLGSQDYQTLKLLREAGKPALPGSHSSPAAIPELASKLPPSRGRSADVPHQAAVGSGEALPLPSPVHRLAQGVGDSASKAALGVGNILINGVPFRASAVPGSVLSGEVPPPNNMGGKPQETPRSSHQRTRLDYLSFTFLDGSPDTDAIAERLMEWTEQRIDIISRGTMMYGYTNSYTVCARVEENGTESLPIGLFCHGGESQKHRPYLSLTGTGCALIKHWDMVHADLAGIPRKSETPLFFEDVRLTNVHLALDDLEGVFSVDSAVRYYEQGAFNAVNGRPPVHRLVGDWLRPRGAGRTLYVGKRGSGKMIRIYEKGKQLGDKESPWVRWEVELRNVDRVLPFDIIIRPDRYFVAAYPCLADMLSVAAEKIKVVKKVAEQSVEKLTEHCKKAYGKFVGFLLHGFGNCDEVVAALIVPGIPRRLRESVVLNS